jgi:ribokinase
MTVCVLGSANLDLVAVVDEAPRLGETVTGREFLQVPGGKGANQAVAAARAGAQVSLLGAVGDDDHAALIRQVLDDAGVDASGLSVVDTPTGTAHIVVDASGDNAIVVVPGANGTVESLTDLHRTRIAEHDVLLLQLELPLGVVVEAATYAAAVGTRVVLTPAPVVELPDELLAAVDVLVPNEHEAARLTGDDDPERAARALLDRGPSSVVVTLGDRGCLYADRAGQLLRVSAPTVQAVDATGAGDTFVGALAVALAEDRPVEQALQWATAAASLSVQRQGASASMPARAEIAGASGLAW